VKIETTRLEVSTDEGTSVADVTADVNAFVRSTGIGSGLCVLTVPRDACFLSVAPDLDEAFDDLLRLAQSEPPSADDDLLPLDLAIAGGPAGDRADVDLIGQVPPGVLAESLSLAVRDGMLNLGSWDAILLLDTAGPASRPIEITLMGAG
jgi:thiamine phosphate synthase YjbQ (UPF0047 family)